MIVTSCFLNGKETNYEFLKKELAKILGHANISDYFATCGNGACDETCAEERVPDLKNIQPHDMVLVATATQHRDEAVIEEVAKSSMKIRRIVSGKVNAGWVALNVIVDNLGPADDETLKKFEFEVPEPPAVPDVKTGAYVVIEDGACLMVEVDRVGEQYIFRFVDDSATYKIEEAAGLEFIPLSDPDLPTMLVEPGIYYVAEISRTVEVIPFQGHAWFRYLDSASLMQLNQIQVKGMQQIESDSIDIGAIAFLPECDMPKEKMPKNGEGLSIKESGEIPKNHESKGCCGSDIPNMVG